MLLPSKLYDEESEFELLVLEEEGAVMAEVVEVGIREADIQPAIESRLLNIKHYPLLSYVLNSRFHFNSIT